MSRYQSAPIQCSSRSKPEAEDDGDQDIVGDIDTSQNADGNVPPPNLRAPIQVRAGRRAVGIVSDSLNPTEGTSESLSASGLLSSALLTLALWPRDHLQSRHPSRHSRCRRMYLGSLVSI